MIEVVVFMLLNISDGMYNRGTVTNVAYFQSEEKCQEVKKEIEGNNNTTKCVQATILIKE